VRSALILEESKRKGGIIRSTPLPPANPRRSSTPSFREKPSGKTDSPAQQREHALKQRRCLDALQEYFAEARKTVALIRRCPPKPRSVAEHLQIVVQRDREAETQRRYRQARKLLLQAAQVSCWPGKRNGC
jgi:hypothetical protein